MSHFESITRFNIKFSAKGDWSFPVDFIMLNANPAHSISIYSKFWCDRPIWLPDLDSA